MHVYQHARPSTSDELESFCRSVGRLICHPDGDSFQCNAVVTIFVLFRNIFRRNINDFSHHITHAHPSSFSVSRITMSLEQKLAALTLDDATSVVETVKSEGVVKSGLGANISTLVARCGSNDEAEVLAAITTVKALAEGCPNAQAFTKECLGAVLEQANSKSVTIKALAEETAFAICDNVNAFGMKSLLPFIFGALPVEKKWPIRELALKCISRFHKNAPKQLGDALPLIVPEVTACMWDTKKQVKVAATEAMKSVLEVVGNKDIEHMTGKILTAITKPKEVPEIMHQMAGVTFVQSVEASALAMVVPLLLRGLREKSTATRRQSAVIINNMSKLVDNPLDAASFLPLLLPALESNADSIADPEARDITDQAVAQLMRLKGLADKAMSVRGDISKLGEEFKKALDSEHAEGANETVLQFACTIASCMMDLHFMEDSQWKKNLLFTLVDFFGKDVAEKGIETTRIAAEGMLDIPEEDDDDDDAEELCNCNFTLAYGTKILLHNTKMKLLRGHRYGLLGANDCGKTTLMRAIANNQVEGFPDVTQVRTVFVESDIQGEQSHLSCVDYIDVDEKIAALSISKEDIRKTLNLVGFTEDGKAKPDHAVSTLSGGWRMKLALARAMLQKADILLLDEPTNHLGKITCCFRKHIISHDTISHILSIFPFQMLSTSLGSRPTSILLPM
jgi:elongation factor 3